MNAIDFCNSAIAYLKVELSADVPVELEVNQGDSPVIRSLGNGLCVAYLVDCGNHFQYVQNRHRAEAGVSEQQLHQTALGNLSILMEERLQVMAYDNIYTTLLGGDFEASLVLLDSFWEEALSELPVKNFIAAIPARDILSFCDIESAVGIQELRDVIARAYDDDDSDHLLTPSLYYRKQGTWVCYPG